MIRDPAPESGRDAEVFCHLEPMMSGATLSVDTAGRILAWSRDAEELLGYSEQEAVGQSIELIIPPHLRGRHHAGFRRFIQTGVTALPEVSTTQAVHKTGATMKVRISVRAVYGAQQDIIAVEALMY
jgi:PAS domain S-box-containing protein